jgi:hypothetical protein
VICSNPAAIAFSIAPIRSPNFATSSRISSDESLSLASCEIFAGGMVFSASATSCCIVEANSSVSVISLFGIGQFFGA